MFELDAKHCGILNGHACSVGSLTGQVCYHLPTSPQTRGAQLVVPSLVLNRSLTCRCVFDICQLDSGAVWPAEQSVDTTSVGHHMLSAWAASVSFL